MMYMNDFDIEMAKRRHASHPVLNKAVRFLDQFREEVDSHSDGWAHWALPVRAAEKLMTLIQGGKATEAEFRKSLAPIKSFYTRRGYAAGMVMPTI